MIHAVLDLLCVDAVISVSPKAVTQGSIREGLLTLFRFGNKHYPVLINNLLTIGPVLFISWQVVIVLINVFSIQDLDQLWFSVLCARLEQVIRTFVYIIAKNERSNGWGGDPNQERCPA
ncbi:MAG: hypothetical protein E5W59_04345 [Mesorhizobium sp.]|nr:MAG: hypothetical protein E5W59_04345 [Mesorhizobium sp.]